MKRIFKFFILTLVFGTTCLPSSAQAYEKINPDSGLYRFKRLGERFNLALKYKQPDNWALANAEYVLRRTEELQYLVDKRNITEIETASSRFNTTIGKIIEVDNKVSKKTKQNIQEKWSNLPERIIAMRDTYPAGCAQWLMLQQNLDVLRSGLAKVQTN